MQPRLDQWCWKKCFGSIFIGTLDILFWGFYSTNSQLEYTKLLQQIWDPFTLLPINCTTVLTHISNSLNNM